MPRNAKRPPGETSRDVRQTSPRRPETSDATSRDVPKPPAGPWIVAFGGQKGGAGKTTTATAVAAEWLARGRRVLLVDTDPQGSATTRGDVAVERGAAAPTVVSMGAGLHRDDQLPALAAQHDVTVVDCPPRLDDRVRAVLMVAHLVVLPCGPSVMDVWALSEGMDLVRQARQLRPHLDVAVLITRKHGRSHLGQTVRGALEHVALPVLGTELGYRLTYQEAPAAGLGPTTYQPKSAAAAEVRALVDELDARRARP